MNDNCIGIFPNVYYDVGASVSGGTGWNWNDQSVDYDYSDYTDNTFTSSNQHIGPICRRAIKEGESKQIVTLFVYRPTPEGGVEGSSITVNISVNELSSEAVDYE